ncbi:MAG: NDP-sugar synthase, partial [Spirochaetota bacterium]
MRTGVILAAGLGSRIWPYAVIRPKVMIPIANRPIISFAVDNMKAAGIRRIIIAAGPFSEQIVNYFRADNSVEVIKVEATKGTADTLTRIFEKIDDNELLILYGDTVVESDDLRLLLSKYKENGNAVLVTPLDGEISRDWICLTMQNGYVSSIVGHPRGGVTHRFCAFALNREIFPSIVRNSGIFTSVEVGMMPPVESYLEMSLYDFINDGGKIASLETQHAFLDIDKPWHILMANYLVLKTLCRALTKNELAEGASIDTTADIRGFVKLGRGSRIGRNVTIKGNLIAGDNTVIENGALINGNAIIGSNSYIGNYCMLSDSSAIGDHSVLSHCAELDGIIMDNVYLYHYMEFYGIIGSHTDLGAATVCGTLRFDDGDTIHRIKGRKEHPQYYSNASFLGDYARTGVNAIIMPGC